MKITMSFLFAAFCLVGFAQPDKDFKDLLSAFVDKKYENVLNKAENYTLRDDTKKHTLPYLYISMSL